MDPEITQWVESTKKDKWGDTPESISFSSYLSESIFVEEAAANITAPSTDSNLPANTKVAIVWAMLFSCIEDCPTAHSQIIELIKAITSHPRPETGETSIKTVKRFGDSDLKMLEGLAPPLNGAASDAILEKDAYWTDLPVFEELWRLVRFCMKPLSL
jgi:hypothetical protein